MYYFYDAAGNYVGCGNNAGDVPGGCVATGVPPVVPPESTNSIWQRIKAERDHRTQTGGYTAAGKWFHADTFSRTQQLGLARKADKIEYTAGDTSAAFLCDDGSVLVWKTMDGTFIPVTPVLAQAVALACEKQDIATFTAAEMHRIAMESAPVPAEYDYSTGWPAIFGG